MTDIERNAAWLPTVKSLSRKIAADYGITCGVPNMQYKLLYGAGVQTALQLPVQPSMNVVGWFYELVAFHKTMMPTHGVVLMGATNIVPITGRTIYFHPLGDIQFAAPVPGPYDLPKPDDLPIQCLPCISPIVIARGPN